MLIPTITDAADRGPAVMDETRNAPTPLTGKLTSEARAVRGVGSCVTCPIGRAAGVGRGGRCPLAPVPVRRGAIVHREQEAAGTICFVERGRVVLGRTLTIVNALAES